MIALLQLIKLLNPEQREMLKEFLLEPDEGFGAYELAEALEYFFHAHYEIDIELTEAQLKVVERKYERINNTVASVNNRY